VNVNKSTELHNEGKEWEYKVRIHSATGCCRIILKIIGPFCHENTPVKQLVLEW
jgi:hypothetical protein